MFAGGRVPRGLVLINKKWAVLIVLAILNGVYSAGW